MCALWDGQTWLHQPRTCTAKECERFNQGRKWFDGACGWMIESEKQCVCAICFPICACAACKENRFAAIRTKKDCKGCQDRFVCNYHSSYTFDLCDKTGSRTVRYNQKVKTIPTALAPPSKYTRGGKRKHKKPVTHVV